MPKISLDKPAEYKDKFDYMATKPKAVNAQAREMTGQLSTMTEKTRENVTGVAKSVEGREITSEGQAAQTSQNTPELCEKWDAEWQKLFDSCLGQNSDSEKPQVMSSTVSRSEARV